MIGLVAFDLVLRVVRAGVMAVALIGHIFGVHPHYPACDPACFGIPAHVIADLEYSRHDASASPALERNVTSEAAKPRSSGGRSPLAGNVSLRFTKWKTGLRMVSANMAGDAHNGLSRDRGVGT